MSQYPAYFSRCRSCRRLITVDGLNPSGRCTRDCDGHAGLPVIVVNSAEADAAIARFRGALERMAAL